MGAENKEIKRKELYFDGFFYDVTNWVPIHPGGSLIEFYTDPGENATIPIQQFHYRTDKKVKAIMKSLPKRAPTLEEQISMSGENDKFTEDFLKLHKELEAEGYFNPSYQHIVFRFFDMALLIALSYFVFTINPFIGLIMVGITAGRFGWLQHECGHNSLTGIPSVDHFLESFFLGFWMGMSGSYWNIQHNCHHANPQRLNRDIDMETMPFIAFNKKVVKVKEEGTGFFVQNQKFLFFFLDSFLISTYWRAYLPYFCFKEGKYLDFFFMLTHYFFIFCILNLTVCQFLLAAWIGASYLLINFSLNHTHLPVTEGPKHWVEYAFEHTANIEPSWFINWWMGFLNYQIEHHLFPAMPQFRHREIAPRVRAFAKKHSLPYIVHSYTGAFKVVYDNLRNVSKELKEGIE